jgi:hypothetical protein
MVKRGYNRLRQWAIRAYFGDKYTPRKASYRTNACGGATQNCPQWERELLVVSAAVQ